MKDIERLTDKEKEEILIEGFDTLFWNVIKRILFSWRATKAHKVGAGRSMEEKDIRIDQGYYMALSDFLSLEETMKTKKKPKVKEVV